MDTDRIMVEYDGLVRYKARHYFLTGGEHQDLVQEGRIGLWKAIQDYREDRGSSFRNFAELCITRQIITAVKTATRSKHTPVNRGVSLSTPVHTEAGDDERTLQDVLPDRSRSAHDELVEREEARAFTYRLDDALSPLEHTALHGLLNGTSYEQTAADNDISFKAVDNAVQRARRKARVIAVEQGLLAA